jgi:hypothetical protein
VWRESAQVLEVSYERTSGQAPQGSEPYCSEA